MAFKMLTLTLPCVLTEQELADRGQSLAKITQEIETKEEEKKASAKIFKDELDAMVGTSLTLSRAISTKTEDRPVECRKEYNVRKGTWKIIREDTAEVTEAGTMTDEERTMGKTLFDNSGEE